MWCVYVYLFSVWPNAKLIRFWPLWRGEIHFRVRIYVANFVLICRIFLSPQLIWTVPSAPTNQPNQLTSLFFKWNRAKKKEKERTKVCLIIHIYFRLFLNHRQNICVCALCVCNTPIHTVRTKCNVSFKMAIHTKPGRCSPISNLWFQYVCMYVYIRRIYGWLCACLCLCAFQHIPWY